MSIRNLDDHIKELLRVRAARNGRSMEAEVRAILSDAVLGRSSDHGLLPAIRDRFAELGGVGLDLPARQTPPRAPDLAS